MKNHTKIFLLTTGYVTSNSVKPATTQIDVFKKVIEITIRH